MESLSLMLGIVLMIVAALGILGYVALVIAIPVCRLIDWIGGPDAEKQAARQMRTQPSLRSRLRSRIGRRASAK